MAPPLCFAPLSWNTALEIASTSQQHPQINPSRPCYPAHVVLEHLCSAGAADTNVAAACGVGGVDEDCSPQVTAGAVGECDAQEGDGGVEVAIGLSLHYHTCGGGGECFWGGGGCWG